MTICTFGAYPEPINETAILDATKRWEEQSPHYSDSKRKATISKLAIGILLSWGAVAASILTTVYAHDDLSVLGIVLTSVFGCFVPFLTFALANLGLNLRKYKPFKYDLDSPETVLKIRKLLSEDSIAIVANSLEDYCSHLNGAGILTNEVSQDLKGYISRHISFSSDRALFMLKHTNEAILSDEKLIAKYSNFESQKTQLETEWETYQTNHLLNTLPRPTVTSSETTSLNHTAVHDVYYV